MMKYTILITFLALQAHASFESTSMRYLSGHEVTAKLMSVLPDSNKSKEDIQACKISTANEAASGMNMPVSGRSIYKEPGSAFLNWYLPCATTLLDKDLKNSELDNQSLKHHLGTVLEKVKTLAAQPPNNGVALDVPANLLSKEEIAELVRFQMERILGPDEVIEELGFNPNAKTLRESITKSFTEEAAKGPSVRTLLKKLELELLSRDEFLVY